MPHSKHLINKILKLVKKDYPDGAHTFVIEKPLVNKKQRMEPDIQVFDSAKTLLCVVEIGYTRPEKLVEYNKLKIPDIRWYSKKGELCDTKKITSTRKRIHYSDTSWRQIDIFCDVGGCLCGECYKEAEEEYYLLCKQSLLFEKNEYEYFDKVDYCIQRATECLFGLQMWFSRYEYFSMIECDVCANIFFGDSGELFEILDNLNIHDSYELMKVYKTRFYNELSGYDDLISHSKSEPERKFFIMKKAEFRKMDSIGFLELKNYIKKRYSINLSLNRKYINFFPKNLCQGI